MGQVTQSGDDSMRKPQRVRVVDAVVRGGEYAVIAQAVTARMADRARQVLSRWAGRCES
jgi:DNA gyrase inhibitor GyrI